MRVLLTVLAVCASAVVAAQTDTAVPSPVVTLSRPEVPPRFPCGDRALKEFIETNLVHPQDCVMGKVWVEFTVETDGNLNDIKIVRGMNAKLDAEAL
ncbi:MAG: hypothetical protein IPJ76_09710 [Flavobacteriales bacterium]|nr:MAG: hypothetical protein IPJ76_09710 [Flavobacteriales bacterium]